ncbi:hypothetical protein EQG49_03585 [Periweissella cryptocerci]|uniref:Bacterial Ig domain-containing protein n=1 Tax=Periweissella cryptocerci TaxID=2506420 RepID=A0A4P6YSC9_9LACO|nr:hypothetical protein [Periweissella cryptocerci]QBO35604.1 hypothetical protein EQG49_03585 [Periweissella cryptocerci]
MIKNRKKIRNVMVTSFALLALVAVPIGADAKKKIKPKQVTITVKYISDKGEQLSQNYSVKVKYGKTYKLKVPSRSVKGYQLITTKKIYTIKKVKKAKTITIKYTPKTYSIKYEAWSNGKKLGDIYTNANAKYGSKYNYTNKKDFYGYNRTTQENTKSKTVTGNHVIRFQYSRNRYKVTEIGKVDGKQLYKNEFNVNYLDSIDRTPLEAPGYEATNGKITTTIERDTTITHQYKNIGGVTYEPISVNPTRLEFGTKQLTGNTITGTRIISANQGKGRVEVLLNNKIIGTANVGSNGTYNVSLNQPISKGSTFLIRTIDRDSEAVVNSETFTTPSWNMPAASTLGSVTNLSDIMNNVKTLATTINTISTGLSFTDTPNIIHSTNHTSANNFYETTANTLTPISPSTNLARSFSTAFFLPDETIPGFPFSAPQNMMIVGNYLYEVIASGNKGRIVRYDMETMKNAGLDANGNNADVLRKIATSVRYNRFVTNKQYDLMQQHVLIGNEFNLGHGQGFAVNYQDNSLWFLANPDGVTKNRLYKINANSLTPEKEYSFTITNPWGTELNGPKNFAFDDQGNFFIAFKHTGADGNDRKNGDLFFYKGTFNNETSTMVMEQDTQVINSVPGNNIQAIAFNKHNGNLYVQTDGAYIALPATAIVNDTLTTDDITTAVYGTMTGGVRESEGMSFDDDGYAYQLFNYGAEIMKSINPDNGIPDSD